MPDHSYVSLDGNEIWDLAYTTATGSQ